MQIPVYNLAGAIVKEIEVKDDVFNVPFNESVVHQAMVRQLADRRLGLASTKDRSEVRGSTRKLYAQKHTGRARRGSIKSPLMRGGGVVFGPHPRSYRQDMPRKMRRLALRCVLSDKLRTGALKVVDRLEMDNPRTREMAAVLANLKAQETVLIATIDPQANMLAAARNLPGVKTTVMTSLSIIDLLAHKVLVATEDAVRKAEELWTPAAKKTASAAQVG